MEHVVRRRRGLLLKALLKALITCSTNIVGKPYKHEALHKYLHKRLYREGALYVLAFITSQNSHIIISYQRNRKQFGKFVSK